MSTQEVWMSVYGLGGNYKVSNLGRVKSLKRKSANGRRVHEKILKTSLCPKGYEVVFMYINSKRVVKKMHRVVMEAFFGPSEKHIDHVNGNRKDNNLDNLEYVNNRENARRGKNCGKSDSKTSKYRNVYLSGNRFVGNISYKGKTVYLGRFLSEEEAFQAVLAFEKEKGIC